MPKKKPDKSWIVPMTWEHRGHAIVSAPDAEEAVARAESGEFCDHVILQEDATAELINWEVTGEAELNE